jgi:DNA-binding SARP family transcriptional activator/predicted ATPase
MLEVRLLGQFRVMLDGEVIEIASRPAQSLFAYLILNPGTEHRREKLAGLFWPDSSESNARNNLRQALWRVRKALGDEEEVEGSYILGDNFTLTFNSQSEYWLDASILEGELPEGWSTEDLIEIISLYEGELLPGFYEDWVILAREHLQASFERKMQRLVERLVGESRWHDVLELGERWIALGQVPELAYRALMIAHGNLGDTSSVASVFLRCKDALETELGVEPSEDTKVTYERFSEGERVTKLYPFAVEARPIESPAVQKIPEVHFPDFIDRRLPRESEDETIFVARERELGRLDEFLQAMLGGSGRVIFVTGDAGSGKTALIQEFARRAQDANPELLVTLGDCSALTGIGDPYLPFREALGLLTGHIESKWTSGDLTQAQARCLWVNLPLAIQTIVEEGPDLLNSFVSGEALLAQGKAYNPGDVGWLHPLEESVNRKASQMARTNLEQRDLFSQYTKVYQTLARRRPILLLLDDLQWADLGSISLLFHIGRKIDESRILIVGAYRPSEIAFAHKGDPDSLAKVIAEFKRHFGDIQVDLESIEHEEGRYFVNALLDTEPNRLGESFREALYHHTGGHPLFTVELLRAMEVRGDLVKDQDEMWVEGTNLDWGRLPARVEGVVEERVNKLDSNLIKLLTVASVEGEEFSAEIIAGVLGLDAKGVMEDLSNELDKRHRLVIAEGVRRWGDQRISQYRFRHTLFQKHLYGQLDPVERANLHEEIGNLLEGLYGEQVDEVAVALARHFDEAGLLDKAVTYYERAGNRAKQLSADEDAIGHFTRGIDLLQSMPDTLECAQRELGLQIALGAPLITIKGYGAPEVQAAFTRARELSIQVLDPPQLFPLIYGLRSFYLMRANHNTARDIAEQLIALAEQEDEPSFFLQAHEALGSTLFYLGELSKARAHLEKGIELYDAEQHQAHAFLYGQDPGVACMSYLALTLWSLGFPDQAMKWKEESIRLARDQDHPFSLALALDFAASLHVLRRESLSVEEYALEAVGISEKQNFPMWMAMGRILLGWAQAQGGEIKNGIEAMQEGMEAWQRTGAMLGSPNFYGLLAGVLEKAKRVEEGQEVISQALEAIERTDERVNEVEIYRLRGELLHKQGADEAEAASCFQQALDVARGQRAKGAALRVATSLARLWMQQGKLAEARAMLLDIYAWFTEGFETLDYEEARALLEEIS